MKRFAGVLIAAAFASASICVQAAEMSDQERTELRQRAQELQSQRSRDPGFQPGEGRANVDHSSAAPGKRAVKSKRTASAKKKNARHNRPARTGR